MNRSSALLASLSLVFSPVSAAAEAQSSNIFSVRLADGRTKAIDCGKLTRDRKLTTDFLVQLDTHNHSWSFSGAQKTDPRNIRILLTDILSDRQNWNTAKVQKVLHRCGHEPG